MDKTKVRDSNLELYRIIVMLLIVAHHYVVNSGLMNTITRDPLSWRSLFLLLFGAWGKTGINCFLMITGYYMCKSQITAKKFAKLLLEVMFYRLVITSIFWITGYSSFSWSALLRLLIPVWGIDKGFTSAFLVFYLFIPFASVLVQHLSERQHLLLLFLCGFTYVFLGTVPGFEINFNYLSWFLVLFLIASYLRLYPKELYRRTKLWGWLTALALFLSVVSVVGCAWLGAKMQLGKPYRFVTDSNSFLPVLTGVCSFLFFRNLRIRPSRVINTIAASTFGVLLIHANSDTMRQWLWQDLLNNTGHYASKWMPLHAIGSVLAIFLVCVAIDRVRIRVLEKPLFAYLDKLLSENKLWNGKDKKV